MRLTHGGRENDDSQDIHAFTSARFGVYNDVRGRCEVQWKVRDVSAIFVLNSVDEDSPCGGLCRLRTYCGHGGQGAYALGAILQ